MARRLRISAPPRISDAALSQWMLQVTDALNTLPALSIISTSGGPESAVTGDSGELAIDIGSSATTLWFKASGNTTTGWQAVTLT